MDALVTLGLVKESDETESLLELLQTVQMTAYRARAAAKQLLRSGSAREGKRSIGTHPHTWLAETAQKEIK